MDAVQVELEPPDRKGIRMHTLLMASWMLTWALLGSATAAAVTANKQQAPAAPHGAYLGCFENTNKQEHHEARSSANGEKVS